MTVAGKLEMCFAMMSSCSSSKSYGARQVVTWSFVRITNAFEKKALYAR